jgi:lambda repressor-like predicted transcriptional regulator
MTTTQVDVMIRLYGDGWSLRQISAALGVDPQTVRNRLRANHVQLRPPGEPPGIGPVSSRRHYKRGTIPVAQVVELAQRGWSIRSIARYIGASEHGVRYHLNRVGGSQTTPTAAPPYGTIRHA